MNRGKPVKDIFQCEIFPTSPVKNSKQDKMYLPKERKDWMKDDRVYQENTVEKNGKINSTSRSSQLDHVNRLNGRSASGNCERDYPLDNHPEYQNYDAIDVDCPPLRNGHSSCDTVENVEFMNSFENGKVLYVNGEDSGCNTFDDYVEIDEGKGKHTTRSISLEVCLHDDNDSCIQHGCPSEKGSMRVVKKRKPPMKPPRLSVSSSASTDSGISSQCLNSPDRKGCLNCHCDFSEHDVSYNEIVSMHKLGQLDIHDVNENILPTNDQYLWYPQGLDEELVEAYMNSIPLEKVPHFENPEGIKYYNKQLIQQLPLQDSNIENVQTLTPKDSHYLDSFKRQRDPEVSTGVVLQADQKLTCKGCNDKIYEEDVYVYGPAVGNDAVWHPNCFVCCTCEELVVNLIYGVRNDQIFCTRHHAEQIKPRCHGCDELIFCGEYIRTDEKAYHSQHFVCVSCETGLSGEQHLLDEGAPICIQCYNQKFANVCHMCNQTIGVDEDDVMYDDEHWHDYCLVCHLCKCPLSGTSFVVKDSNFLCADCFQKTDDKRCNVCGEGFEPGTKRLELRGEYWHDTCFACDICKDPITSKKFINHEGKQVCCPCFDAKFAKRCDRCKEILKEGGVSCGGAFFHRDCFVCENCSSSIANQAFQQKDGMRFCTPCYKQMYAKTCKGCGDFIVNGEFYTVESDNWHKNCFKCVSCDEILRQQSFVQENGKIKLICENCL